jgi:glucose-6-phosphate isomerase
VEGHTGKSIKNVVNIGIGGSDLGPVMAYEALRYYSRRDLTFHFVSNVDSTDLVEALRDLEADETLFIISSKTFGTLETLTNATSARNWLIEDSATSRPWRSTSSRSPPTPRRWPPSASTPTTCSSSGTGSAVATPWRAPLDSRRCSPLAPSASTNSSTGFHAMDEHFRTAPFEENLPVLMGLLAVWNRDFLGCPSVGVMPYEQYLKRLPAYLQQLTMESNGKHVTLDGARVDYDTGAVYWGEPGTNGQHSFYQLIHQGHDDHPGRPHWLRQESQPLGEHHDILSSNVFAQAQALAFGKTADEVRAEGTPEHVVPHRVMEGNRPTNVLLAEVLTPRSSVHSSPSTNTRSSPRAPSGASTPSTSGAWNWASNSRSRSSPNLSPRASRRSPTTRRRTH